MFSRPSHRSRSQNKVVELNLVPMMDALVVIISFLMSTIAFVALVEITSPLPIVSDTKKVTEKPLQLTLTLREKDSLIWSPFQLIQDRTLPHKEDGAPDIEGIHRELVAIKKRFQSETQIILVPPKNTPYELLVEVIDAVRHFFPLDDKLYIQDETGEEIVEDRLFPEITFGNLLEG